MPESSSPARPSLLQQMMTAAYVNAYLANAQRRRPLLPGLGNPEDVRRRRAANKAARRSRRINRRAGK